MVSPKSSFVAGCALARLASRGRERRERLYALVTEDATPAELTPGHAGREAHGNGTGEKTPEVSNENEHKDLDEDEGRGEGEYDAHMWPGPDADSTTDTDDSDTDTDNSSEDGEEAEDEDEDNTNKTKRQTWAAAAGHNTWLCLKNLTDNMTVHKFCEQMSGEGRQRLMNDMDNTNIFPWQTGNLAMLLSDTTTLMTSINLDSLETLGHAVVTSLALTFAPLEGAQA